MPCALDQIEELSSKTEKKAFNHGDVIMRQGESFAKEFWIIFEGAADAFWTDPETQERHHVSADEWRISMRCCGI